MSSCPAPSASWYIKEATFKILKSIGEYLFVLLRNFLSQNTSYGNSAEAANLISTISQPYSKIRVQET